MPAKVLITVDGAPLDSRSSLAVRNYSPTGPAWGYGGSSPAQSGAGDFLLAVTPRSVGGRPPFNTLRIRRTTMRRDGLVVPHRRVSIFRAAASGAPQGLEEGG